MSDKHQLSYLENNKLHVLVCFFLFILPVSLPAQQTVCPAQNKAFGPGEKITYRISYNWGHLWVNAGEVTFEVFQELYRNQAVYHIVSNGRTYKSYDWFFKVRDRYETYCDTSSLLPLRFKRSVREGDYSLNLQYIFNSSHTRAFSVYKKRNDPVVFDTIPVTDCTFDVLSIIYSTRNIDFSFRSPGDTIPITILLDNELNNLYIRYLGKANYRSEKMGTFRCVLFSPLLVEGTIFEGGEGMKVWVTDDENKVPILVESPIVIGSIKARIKSWKGLRNKTTSLIR